MPLTVRQLQPTETGLPLEIYAFVYKKNMLEYEPILADIFDHILAVLPFFLSYAYFKTQWVMILKRLPQK